ncbi:hypothetical protein JFN88_08315 [Paenibacillus sp. MAHUQ-46]|uniref:Uncharacterized protein n=1 Tax=Paenibacillus roseus TaxID=2798579 RepID=A0A934J5T1_9BACL|nr:hypothetical protein [Paenibacillus roseus]MBJ6361311.1 hypothetical protein [Paenibacillus roseus]
MIVSPSPTSIIAVVGSDSFCRPESRTQEDKPTLYANDVYGVCWLVPVVTESGPRASQRTGALGLVFNRKMMSQ